MNIAEELEELQHALYDLSARNPFINVSVKNLWFQNEEDHSIAKKIFNKAQFYQKEYALETTLLVTSFIKWKAPEKEVYFISPLTYHTCKLVFNRKIDDNYQPREISDNLYVNPILRHAFETYFDAKLPALVENKEVLFSVLYELFNNDSNQLESTDRIDHTEQWQLIDQVAIGNFNYKKSLLGEDFKQFSNAPNKSLVNFLSGTRHSNQSKSSEGEFINPLDETQKNAILRAMEGDLVIQGPPGTGKSHTIVSLIGSYLLEHKKVLFVSEKRSALDVVFNRLKENKLHYWTAYFNTEKDEKKEFYRHLKSAWEKVAQINTNFDAPQINARQTDIVFSKYPALLLAYNQELNGNLKDLVEILLESDFKPQKVEIKGRVPKYGEWKENLEFLTSLEERYIKEKGTKYLNEAIFLKLNRSLFKEENPVVYLEKRLSEICLVLDKVQSIQQKYGWNKELDAFIRLAISASIMGMVNRNQLSLLNREDKGYKSFSNWAKKYEVAKNKVTQLEHANAKWSIKPSISEITELLDLLKHHEAPKGILGFLKRNPARIQAAFKDFDPHLSNVAKQQLLESVRAEWHAKNELDEIRIKLAHDLHISDPEKEIEHILRLRAKLDEVGQNDYIELLDNVQSLELIKDLELAHADLQQLQHQSRFIFGDHLPKKIAELKNLAMDVKGELQLINQWLPEIRKIFTLPFDQIDFILSNKYTISELNCLIAYQNLLNQTRFETLYKRFTGWDIKSEYKQLSRFEHERFKSNIKKIQESCAQEIKKLELLLNTPASKLSEKNKELKKKYRSDKRTIIHEVNKKQQHLAVKTLFEEAEKTLLDVQPIWMMNPLAVSGSLPCIADLFDVVIFDESSQIPLEDALPSIYRAKQVIVVGDSNQMPPSKFFSSNESSRTLLDQSDFAYDQLMLKWHYRSEHPLLIDFSNRHFYENELICLPPIQSQIPIQLHEVNGLFEDGKNTIEAEALVQMYKSLLSQGKKNIAIITFSKEQENCIASLIQKHKVDSNEELLLRNLENVQGIERDIVLISIGYGPNSEGVFRMNFGPVNQENGANRLNVMFTRARKEMIVFSSVDSSDFKLSDNRGVQILKDFLNDIEQLSDRQLGGMNQTLAQRMVQQIINANKLDVAFYDVGSGLAVSCFVQHDTNKILLVDPGLGEAESKDIYNLLNIFDKKYKDWMVVLSIDLWNNRSRIVKEVISFFS